MENQKRKYSESFKWKVVKSVLAGECTKEEARKIYGIKSNCAILYWIREFNGVKNYRQASEFEVSKNKRKEITGQEQKKANRRTGRRTQARETSLSTMEKNGRDCRRRFRIRD